MNPNVSVIVPNYNHARYLRRRVESILAQTYQDFELILLDDCSTDESQEILCSYGGEARVKIELNETNSGSTYKQWNKGVGMARGKYVWIAESDDYADAHLLGSLVSLLNEQPETVLAYCRSWRVLGDGMASGFADPEDPRIDTRRWEHDFRVKGCDLCREHGVFCNIFPNASAVLFRRTAFLQGGPADERLKLCGDWKLWMAMAMLGEVAYLAQPLNYYRFHESSVRAQSLKWVTAELAAECLEVTSFLDEEMSRSEEAVRDDRFEHALLDGYRYAIATLEPSNPGAVLRAIQCLLRHSDSQLLQRWELADAWLVAARVHRRQGHPGRAILATWKGLAVRPALAARPLKRIYGWAVGSRIKSVTREDR